MKQITQNEATEAQLMNFEEFTKPVKELIARHWNIELSPKGFEEFMKGYEEGDGMGEDQYDLHQEFLELGGIMNVTASGPALPGLIDLPTVAYNQEYGRRSPAESLFNALIHYGLIIGQAQEKRFSGGMSKTELLQKHVKLSEEMLELSYENRELKKKLADLEGAKT